MFPAINKLSGLKSFLENVARYIIQTKNNFNRDPLNYLLLFLVTIKFIFTNLQMTQRVLCPYDLFSCNRSGKKQKCLCQRLVC